MRTAAFVLMSLITVQALASAGPPAMSSEEFDQLAQDISNWGRWGKDDELGTLNLITEEKRRAAAQLVEKGITVSLALDANKTKDMLNTHPFIHELKTVEQGGHQAATDRYEVDYHGLGHTHLDGLPHVAHKGYFYNGVPFAAAKPDGAEKLGIHAVGVNGIFTRGVLVDMPRHLGVDYLEPGTAITADDLVAWEKKSGVRIGSGDVLLIRTGRWEKVRQDGQWEYWEAAAGPHASLAAFLKERDVAIIGGDGANDVYPSGVEGKQGPLHELVLAGLGMRILDNLDLDLLAQVASEQNRTTFLFVSSPLRVRGGTGSPVNPLAVF